MKHPHASCWASKSGGSSHAPVSTESHSQYQLITLGWTNPGQISLSNLSVPLLHNFCLGNTSVKIGMPGSLPGLSGFRNVFLGCCEVPNFQHVSSQVSAIPSRRGAAERSLQGVEGVEGLSGAGNSGAPPAPGGARLTERSLRSRRTTDWPPAPRCSRPGPEPRAPGGGVPGGQAAARRGRCRPRSPRHGPTAGGL